MTGPLFVSQLAQGSPLAGASIELVIVLGYSALVTTAYIVTRRSLQEEQAENDRLREQLERERKGLDRSA